MAVTGYVVGTQCYGDQASALTAITAQYPVLDNGLLVIIKGGTYTAPNTFNLWMDTYATNGATTTVQTKTVSLARCDPAIALVGQGTAFDAALAGGLWMFGITIVLACYLIAKNIGLILEAIKRW